MRIFKDLVEAHTEIQRDLFEVGVWIKGHTVQDKNVAGDESYDFMELSPYLWCFTRPWDAGQVNSLIKHLDLNRAWLNAEFNERIASWTAPDRGDLNLNPGTAWKLRRETWEEFIEHGTMFDGQFSYTYAERFGHAFQLRKIERQLKAHPHTRQAILGVHSFVFDSRNMGSKHRVPCSMFYHFMIRDGNLNLHYVMRSCDFFTHFPYDIILAMFMQAEMATRVGVPIGVFTHFSTSLHGFRKDFPEGVF